MSLLVYVACELTVKVTRQAEKPNLLAEQIEASGNE